MDSGLLHQLRTVRICLLVIVVAVLSACQNFGVPSEDDARAVLSREHPPISMGLATIKSFTKTNGQESEVFGVKYYKLEYSAELEYTGEERNSWGLPAGVHTKSGTFMFEKTEKGWKGPDGAFY